jgi:RNA polymerase sigma factor (sigma-70 family)
MRASTTDYPRLVVAAQAGDEKAREELITACLPLVYNLVGRALPVRADVDDVVQETVLRVLRDLPALRTPESFQSWVAAIAIRQSRAHQQRRRVASERTMAIDEAPELLAAGVDVEDAAILRLHVAAQRRQIVGATDWLDPDDRRVLALWWQETAGLMSRSEVAAALQVSVAHAGVRLQRMREQLGLSRTIVAALGPQPRCPTLEVVVARWDGRPTPLWRKRIGRHVRDCVRCDSTTENQMPAESLLATFALLPVPVSLTAALLAKGLLPASAAGAGSVTAHALAVTGSSGGKASLIGKVAQLAGHHPVAAGLTGATLTAAIAVTYATWSAPPAPPLDTAGGATSVVQASNTPAGATSAAASRASSAPAPSSTPGGVPVGVWSFEAVDRPGQYLTYAGDLAETAAVSSSSGPQIRRRANFTVVRGLADSRCVTFRAADGRYLRHSNLQLRLSPDEQTRLFRADSTFCPGTGAVPRSVVLRSFNYPALLLHCRDGGIWADAADGSVTFTRESSFITRAAWAA